MSNLPTVNVVTNAEREKALLTVVAAFAADPVVRWIVPQADIYLNHGVRFFDIFGGAASPQALPMKPRASPAQRCGCRRIKKMSPPTRPSGRS